MGDSVDEALTLLNQIGPAPRVLAALDTERRIEAEKALYESLAAEETDEGIDLVAAAWLVTARA